MKAELNKTVYQVVDQLTASVAMDSDECRNNREVTRFGMRCCFEHAEANPTKYRELSRGQIQELLKKHVRQRMRQEYGFVLTTIVLFAILTGLISWLTKRFLDWYFGDVNASREFIAGIKWK